MLVTMEAVLSVVVDDPRRWEDNRKYVDSPVTVFLGPYSERLSCVCERERDIEEKKKKGKN